MKSLVSILVVLVITVVLPMVLLNGKKLPDFSNFHFVRPGASGVKLSSGINDVTTDKPVHIYRWRDAHGILQLSSTKPPKGVKYEEVELKPNLSSMDAIDPLSVPVSDTSSGPKPSSVPADTSELKNLYSPAEMKQMIDQAKTLKEQVSKQQVDEARTIKQVTGQ